MREHSRNAICASVCHPSGVVFCNVLRPCQCPRSGLCRTTQRSRNGRTLVYDHAKFPASPSCTLTMVKPALGAFIRRSAVSFSLNICGVDMQHDTMLKIVCNGFSCSRLRTNIPICTLDSTPETSTASADVLFVVRGWSAPPDDFGRTHRDLQSRL